MRLAHLILAHSNPNQLDKLVASLANTNADIYIHIDKKINIQPFLKIKNLQNVYFIDNRIKVNWGAYSIVQATLNGFKAIVASNKIYGYINLLSGQDYPIKAIDYMHNYLEVNAGKAFMEFYSIENVWKEAIPRLTEYHFTNYKFPGRNIVQKWINVFLPTRKLPNGLIPVGRSQWFTITGEQVKYILDYLNKNPNVPRFFKFTWGADELFFQTILYNSSFREFMVNDNLRYIDWSGGGASPKTFTIDDAAQLLNSNKFFARKFSNSPNDPLVLLIDNKNKSVEKI